MDDDKRKMIHRDCFRLSTVEADERPRLREFNPIGNHSLPRRNCVYEVDYRWALTKSNQRIEIVRQLKQCL